MFGMFKSETIMSVHVWFGLHRHSGSICRGHMAGLENPNISYPRSSKISDSNLRIELLSSMSTTLSLRSGFTRVLPPGYKRRTCLPVYIEAIVKPPGKRSYDYIIGITTEWVKSFVSYRGK